VAVEIGDLQGSAPRRAAPEAEPSAGPYRVDGKASAPARPRSRVDRLRSILDVVDSEITIGVDQLAERVGVSAATIRRDLAHLAGQGLVTRSRGGAMRLHAGPEVPVYYRAKTFAAEKRRIGSLAATMIGDGTVVGITGGTTTMEVARAIAPRQGLTVVTNALDIGYELALRRDIRLVLTGGVCRADSFELSGPIAESTLDGYHLDVAIVGVDGIDRGAGCTTHDDVEARANKALVARAQRAIVVADHSKIGRITFASICQLAAVDMLFTDHDADREATASLEEAGLHVVLA
jgi:DeoR family transcriptional regulator of aga operon